MKFPRASRFAKLVRAHRFLAACICVALPFILLNLAAFLHARAMTHFVRGGSRTDSPEQLGFGQKLWILATGVSVPRIENDKTPADYGLSFTTHRIPMPDGTVLEAWHARNAAARPPAGLVILCHAYASSKSSLLPVAREFTALGYDTLLIDFRGSGGSSGDDTTIGYRDGDDLETVIAFARREFSPKSVVLFGQSMGASAAMRAVGAKHVSVDALIVEAPFNRMLSTVENRFHAMHLPAFPFARLLVFWGGAGQGYSAFDHNPETYAESITCPTLLIYGSDDPRVTPAESEAIFAHLAAPDKRRARFEHVGHASFLEHDRARWITEVCRLLNGL